MSESTSLPVITTQASTDPMLGLVERAARDPNVDVAKMERLLAMAEQIHARQSQVAYDQAMNAAQSEMRPVAQDADNPQTRSRYASYGALDRAVRPIYSKHGFSLSFGTRATGPDRVTVTCRVSHALGHTERVEIDMPADGKGAKGGDVMTKTHATGSAVSYGMRYLLKMIFNVAVGEYDDDGNAASPPRGEMLQGYKAKQAGRPKLAPKPAGVHRAHSMGPEPTVKTTPADLEAFQERCKHKIVELAASDPKLGPYWHLYAIDKGWILPNEELKDMLGNPTQVFKLNPQWDIKGNSASVSEQFLAFGKDVQALYDADNQPESHAQPEIADIIRIGGANDAAANGCPKCGHKTVTISKDYDGVMVCGACGWQWDVETGNYYEEHPWQAVVCPIPHPKGTPKKEYDQQPITLGQMFRLDPRRAFGIVMNFKAEGWTNAKGKFYPPTQADKDFEKACKQAQAHMKQSEEPNSPEDDTGYDTLH